MTMSTSVYVRGPVNPERLFRFVQSLLSESPQDDYHRLPGEPYVRPDGSTYAPSDIDNGQWGNRIGQGLPALMHVTYGSDGPLTVEYYDCEGDKCWHAEGEPCEADPMRQWGPFCAHVWMDTTYGYEEANGAHCGDLHAYLVGSIAAWLSEQPGEPGFVWQNGETDITSTDLDRLSELGDPIRGIPPGALIASR